MFLSPLTVSLEVQTDGWTSLICPNEGHYTGWWSGGMREFRHPRKVQARGWGPVAFSHSCRAQLRTRSCAVTGTVGLHEWRLGTCCTSTETAETSLASSRAARETVVQQAWNQSRLNSGPRAQPGEQLFLDRNWQCLLPQACHDPHCRSVVPVTPGQELIRLRIQ